MSDIPSLSEKEEQGGTLQFPNVKATQLRQSIPNKKSDKVEPKVSGMFQTPHRVIVKPSLLLILMTLFSPQHWTLIKYDSPVSGNFAELGVTDAIFPPCTIPLTAYVGLPLAQVAGSEAPN